MKTLLILLIFLFAFQTINAQIDRQMTNILRERVDVGKTNQSIVAAVVDEKGTRFAGYQIARKIK